MTGTIELLLQVRRGSETGRKIHVGGQLRAVGDCYLQWLQFILMPQFSPL